MDLDFWHRHMASPCDVPSLTRREFQGLSNVQGRYMDKKIYQYIHNHMKWEEYVEWEYNGFHVAFSFVHTSCPSSTVRFYLWLFIKLLHGFHQWVPLTQHMQVVLVDVPTPKKHRKIHRHPPYRPLTSKEVNSGMTVKYTMTHACQVYVYRREEMGKVLIHEMIHAFGIDHSSFPPLLEATLQRYFQSTTPLHVNETFTDALACYWNALFYTLLQHGNDPHWKSWFQHYLAQEQSHVLEQAYHVLCLYGSWNVGGEWHPYPHVSEKTHAISYFILKGVVYSNLRLWTRWLQSHRHRLLDPPAFMQLLERGITTKRSSFWKHMRALHSRGTVLGDSLRMSYLDMDTLIKPRRSKLLKTLEIV